ncbi:MAG: hypothetical protein R6W67_02510 [Bacteroidales bacterium]
MRRIFTVTLVMLLSLMMAEGQQNSTEVLEQLEQGKQIQQQQPKKGVTKGALRLFGEKDDLTTVILLVPNGVEVEIIATDGDYLLVRYEDYTGFLVADKVQMVAVADTVQQQVAQQQAVQQQVVQKQAAQQQSQQEYRMNPGNRMIYLEHKYGKDIATKIYAGKIWKGMTTAMVRDAWGEPDRTNRVVVNSIVKEEWIYRSTWLLMEQGKLVEWGPVGR